MADEERITLRLSPPYVKIWRLWADRSGVTLSAFLKQALVRGARSHAEYLGVYRSDDEAELSDVKSGKIAAD